MTQNCLRFLSAQAAWMASSSTKQTILFTRAHSGQPLKSKSKQTEIARENIEHTSQLKQTRVEEVKSQAWHSQAASWYMKIWSFSSAPSKVVSVCWVAISHGTCEVFGDLFKYPMVYLSLSWTPSVDHWKYLLTVWAWPIELTQKVSNSCGRNCGGFSCQPTIQNAIRIVSLIQIICTSACAYITITRQTLGLLNLDAFHRWRNFCGIPISLKAFFFKFPKDSHSTIECRALISQAWASPAFADVGCWPLPSCSKTNSWWMEEQTHCFCLNFSRSWTLCTLPFKGKLHNQIRSLLSSRAATYIYHTIRAMRFSKILGTFKAPKLQWCKVRRCRSWTLSVPIGKAKRPESDDIGCQKDSQHWGS